MDAQNFKTGLSREHFCMTEQNKTVTPLFFIQLSVQIVNNLDVYIPGMFIHALHQFE